MPWLCSSVQSPTFPLTPGHVLFAESQERIVAVDVMFHVPEERLRVVKLGRTVLPGTPESKEHRERHSELS